MPAARPTDQCVEALAQHSQLFAEDVRIGAGLFQGKADPSAAPCPIRSRQSALNGPGEPIGYCM